MVIPAFEHNFRVWCSAGVGGWVPTGDDEETGGWFIQHVAGIGRGREASRTL